MGRHGRAAFGALVLAVAVAGCAAQAATAHRTAGTPRSAPASAPTVTVSHTTLTYRADGMLAVPVARTLSGSCFVATIEAAPATNAYRCISGDSALLDPCVVPPGVARPTVLACRSDPWSPATLLRLTAALPAAQQPNRATRPWAMQLTGGVRCVAVTGTVITVDGVAPAYTCSDGARASAPRASSTGLWHADVVSTASGRSVVTRGVAVTDTWKLATL